MTAMVSHDHCLEGATHVNYLGWGGREEVSKDCFQHKCCQREVLKKRPVKSPTCVLGASVSSNDFTKGDSEVARRARGLGWGHLGSWILQSQQRCLTHQDCRLLTWPLRV